MSVFRKFRGGSLDSSDDSRRDTLAAPPIEDYGSTGSTLPTLPHRAKSEPGQEHLVLRSSQTSQADRRSSTESGVSVASTTSFPPIHRRYTTGEKDLEAPLGLNYIHGSSKPSADVIFVHGLGGSSLKTWSWERNPDVFWPGWLINEEGLCNFRVFSYGYNANFRNPENPISIMDFSKSLLIGMKAYGRERADDIGVRPIVFVAHSMGGLVVKRALIIGKNDKHYSMMLSKVHGIMFFSTPHRGSVHARTLNNFLSLMASTKVYVSELDSSSTSIEDINEQFRTICSELHLVSFYENLPTKLLSGVRKLIVGKDTGVLGYPNEITAPVDADHHTICKFSSQVDPGYMLAVNLLRQMTRGLQPQGVHVHSGSTSPTAENTTQLLQKILGIQGNLREDLDSNLNRALPGSCEWLHRSGNFKEWLSAAHGHYRVLWFTGLPGSGKSTLAAKTIDHIQRSMDCQYHFFIGAQPAKRNAAYCLRALAFQLATSYPAFAEGLIHLYKETKFVASSQQIQIIWDTIFEGIIFKMDFGTTLHWVFDGLDEADKPTVLLRNFLQMRPRSPVKLLFLSRPKRELTSLAGPHSDTVFRESISIEHTLEDIQSYINSVVTEILPQDEVLQKYVIDKIARRAEGSFLWTRLALDSLWESWHTQADMESALNNVPNELQTLYERMLDNVKSQPPRLREIAFRVLNWAACSSRPLTIAELVSALKPEFDGFNNLAETAVQICGQFIRVDHGTISLIHGTARHFLVKASTGTNLTHDYLANVCLRYLSQNTWQPALFRASDIRSSQVDSDRLERVYGEFPFLKYAMGFWAYHVSHSSANSQSLISHLRLFCHKYILVWINAVALAGNLRTIPRAAQYLKKWLRHRRKSVLGSDPLTPGSSYQSSAETTFLEKWATDLIRLVGKFGANLVQSPSAIHRHVAPFCPAASIVSETYHQSQIPLITVDGISGDDWDDNLARLSVGQDEMASVIRSAGVYFFVLISHNGTVIVQHSETCEELRRICHGEWVTLMEANKTGSLVATGGRFTTRIWETSTSQQLHTVPRNNDVRLVSLSFAQSGARLTSAYDDCSLISYDFDSSTQTTSWKAPNPDNCPRFTVVSPDDTTIAVGFRGRPVEIWDVDMLPGQEPRYIIRSADSARREDSDEVFNTPEVARWHPDESILYILYHDNIILTWNLIDNTQAEIVHTEAREMVLNENGTCMLTSSNGGSVSVWGLPKFNLIYRLQSDEFVRDLTFSPDGQRIYDVRGSGCNVWAPDVLVRLEEVDPEEKSSSFGDSVVSDVLSEPVFAEDKSKHGRVTALVCDEGDEFFCCGRDDGSVTIHEMVHGERVRKVCSHSSTVDIISINWSPSRRYMASADDSGKIIAKRLKLKEDKKWAVFAMFDLRVEEAISQLLFSLDEAFLLVSTETTDRLWDLKKKIQIRKLKRGSRSGWKWINHPDDESQLICLGPTQLCIHKWENLDRIDPSDVQSPVMQGTTASSAVDIPSVVLTGPGDSPESVNNIVFTEGSHFLLYEVLPGRGAKRAQATGVRLDLVEVSNLTPSTMDSVRRRTLVDLGSELKHILGSYQDRVVYLDHDNWVCTSSISWEMGSKKRHYFLPSDWVNDATLQVILVNETGTLLCGRNGEVAIVRYRGVL